MLTKSETFQKSDLTRPSSTPISEQVPCHLLAMRVSWEVSNLAGRNVDLNKTGSINKKEGEEYGVGKQQWEPPMTSASIC